MCKRENSINKYKEINSTIKRECAIAKENWYNGKREELEKLKKQITVENFINR